MRLLITGHAGFIGTQAWNTFRKMGYEVFGIDDMSRATSREIDDRNSIRGDVCQIRQEPLLQEHFDWVLHLAGQVSVVAGEEDPVRNFHSNVRGTFEVVQWAKERSAGVIFGSSNKVFGSLPQRTSPIGDGQPILPETNYGVSKASASHYVADYSKGWVLHQSCIYGPSQRGEVDQGWVGWLANSMAVGKPVTCFGDGSQVRDLLHVDDLLRLYGLILSGRIPADSYVVGGGQGNAVSFEEVVNLLGGDIAEYADWRRSDQRYFVSANEGVSRYGWSPEHDARSAVMALRPR